MVQEEESEVEVGEDAPCTILKNFQLSPAELGAI